MATLARRVLDAWPLALLLISAGCAHAPAGQRSALRDPAEGPGALPEVTLDGDEPEPDPRERVLVTGSRIPQPMSRNGIPLTYSPVRIIYWRGQQDLRTLRYLDPAFHW
jgi:hypothetical protein